MRAILAALLITAMLLASFPHGQVYSPSASPIKLARPAVNFNDPVPIEYSAGPDLSPAALQSPDGTLWVAWQSSRSGSFQIYYRTYDGVTWSATQIVSSPAAFNSAPSIARLSNGTIALIWSAGTSGVDNHLYYTTFRSGAWASPVQLTTGSSFADELSKTVVSFDSTLWVFYERDTSTGPSTPPNRQIYYKTLKGNVWSSDTPFTIDTASNEAPSVTLLKDGRIWVAWSRTATAGGDSTIFYRFFNGTQWSGDLALNSPGSVNSQPNLLQDRNGTIWLFWARPVALNGTVSQNTLFYKTSADVGATWSSDVQLTTWGDLTHPVDNLSPFAVQGIDDTIYIFFATNIVPIYDFDIYYIQTSAIYPVHNVALTGITGSPLRNYPYGDRPTNIATVTVTVAGPGDFNENVPLTVQMINKTGSVFWTSTQTRQVLSGTSLVFTFSWNVSGVHPGKYTALASVPRLAGQTLGNAIANTLSFSSIIILYAGDVNHDGVVNTPDFVIMGQSFGTRCGDPRFLPDADLNRNCKIDTPDFVIAGQNFSKRVS